MQSIFSSRILSGSVVVLLALSLLAAGTLSVGTASADTIFSDSFGTGSMDTDVPGWDESATPGVYVDASNSPSSPNGGRIAYVGGGLWMCHTVSTTGYTGLAINYYWRGDTTAENDESGLVQYATSGTCASATWTTVGTHELDDAPGTNVDEGWSTLQSDSLPNGVTLIRFTNNANDTTEYFRVDGASVTGDLTPTTGSLTVTKNTVGGNGTFALTLTGPTGSTTSMTTAGNTGSVTFTNLTPGTTYAVTEETQTGWDETSNTCSSVTVTAGNTATCTITNTQRGSITVEKVLKQPDGTTDATGDDTLFTIHVGDSSQQVSNGGTVTFENLAPGSYTVTEDIPSDYEFLSFSQDGNAEANGAQVTVVAGDDTDLTITNKQQYGTLHILKEVDNSESGTNVAGDFSFVVKDAEEVTVSGPTAFTPNEENSLLGSTDVSLAPGTYTVSEPNSLGYAVSYSETGCINVVITSGGEATCTITNEGFLSTMGSLTVIKNVVNDNGGDANEGDFGLMVNGDTVTSGQANFYEPGSFTISEDEEGPEGYSYEGTVCTDNGGPMTLGENTFSLEAGHVYVCVVTNDDIPATLIIEKSTLIAGPTFDDTFNFTISGTELTPSVTTSGGTGQTEVQLDAGTYDVQEVLPEEGWFFDYSACEYGEGGAGTSIENGEQITVGIGDVVTCTFYNDPIPGELTIIKKTIGGDGTFNFNITGPDFSSSPSIPTTEGEGSSGPISIYAGTYTILEAAQTNWTLTKVSCEYNNESEGYSIAGGEEITLDNGDEVTCTFTNRVGIGIVGYKWNDEDADGIWDENESGLSGWTITATPVANSEGDPVTDEEDTREATSTVTNSNGWYTFFSFFPVTNGGWWKVTEELQDDWAQTFPEDGYHIVQLANNLGARGIDFGNYRDVFACSDGIDNDGDGMVDYGIDPGCTDRNSDSETAGTESNSDTGGGGGGGNGPISGSLGGGGQVLGASTTGGQVLGASTGTPDTNPSCDSALLLKSYMRRGMANDPAEVRKLQEFLNKEMGSGLPVTGFFGPLTEAAVKAFQAKYAADVLTPWGLTQPTGYVYKTTMWKINSIICASLNLPQPQVP